MSCGKFSQVVRTLEIAVSVLCIDLFRASLHDNCMVIAIWDPSLYFCPFYFLSGFDSCPSQTDKTSGQRNFINGGIVWTERMALALLPYIFVLLSFPMIPSPNLIIPKPVSVLCLQMKHIDPPPGFRLDPNILYPHLTENCFMCEDVLSMRCFISKS